MRKDPAAAEEHYEQIGYDVFELDTHDIQELTNEELAEAVAYMLQEKKRDRKECAIRHYQPVEY